MATTATRPEHGDVGIGRRGFLKRIGGMIGIAALYVVGFPAPARAATKCWTPGQGYMTSHDSRAHSCNWYTPECAVGATNRGHEYWKRYRNGSSYYQCCSGDSNGCTGTHSCTDWQWWLQYVSTSDCGCGCN